ncbi:MAG: ABC transporter ATP-binding protein [Lachnospiraceae bacterium]|nr:ABC transporter ATP-binding protein [Lachnospiraceae bacterium]
MIKIFKNLSKKDWGLFFISIGLIVLQVWLDLRLPDYMSEITKYIETPGSEIRDVLGAGGKMLLCALFSMVSAACVSVIASRVASDFSAITRQKVYYAVEGFSMGEMHHFSTASLITRTTNDVTQVQTLIVMGMQVIIKAPIMAVWAIMKIYNKNLIWTISTGVAVVILMTIIAITIALALPKFRAIQRMTDDVNRVTRENLTGLKVIHAYNAEEDVTKKFEVVNQTLTSTNLYTSRAMAFLIPSIMAVLNGLALAIYWLGAIMINEAELTEVIDLFSDMIVFSSYAIQVIMAFMMLVMIFFLYPRASVAAKRILEVTEEIPSLVDGKETEGLPNQEGSIAFHHVGFHYSFEDGDVISDINFSVKKGETLAIIGATGSGKTTVINLIPRFYDANHGSVLVDGRDVKEYTQEALHNKIAYVSQTAQLFSGSIRENIAYGENGKNEVSDEDIQFAMEVACAKDFIMEKEDGLDSYVSQNGKNFSGGQRQRISIARAVARRPEILIFDDSFSALDYKTDRMLRDNLKKQLPDVTKVIVAQRIGTIRDADQIICLSDGQMAGIGTHEELMRSCEEYQAIALSQLSKEELA